MRILLLVSAFNSLTQLVFCRLRDGGYEVAVEYAHDRDVMRDAVHRMGPDLILCPYLMQKIPSWIYEKIPTIIYHPGPPGDRGPSSLDWAILQERRSWGLTLLQANDEMDAGDIWAWSEFVMRRARKGEIYRKDIAAAALALTDEFMQKFTDGTFTPLAQESLSGVDWHIHRMVRQSDRAIDWERDTTQSIIRKIDSADNQPGILDEIAGLECYLYGACEESELRGKPKEIIAKRDGAICLGTVDSAIWISHLAQPGRFKLPATQVLKSRIKGVKEKRIPLFTQPGLKSFKEITFYKRSGIGYLGFDFYNGAMSSQQCIRLKYAIETVANDVDILVLLGGENFFCNGIHLNILEESKKQGEDGWSNINAMNSLVESVLMNDEILTVASFGANAGAGGVFLGLACDFAVASERVVLNPHYKTMGLSGSEYHSYTLPLRVTEERAREILEEALPMSAKHAKEISIIDEVLPIEDYMRHLYTYCEALLADEERYYELLDEKRERLKRDAQKIAECRERELSRMHPQFWDPDSDFHRLRHEFVYKICRTKAPERLWSYANSALRCDSIV